MNVRRKMIKIENNNILVNKIQSYFYIDKIHLGYKSGIFEDNKNN